MLAAGSKTLLSTALVALMAGCTTPPEDNSGAEEPAAVTEQRDGAMALLPVLDAEAGPEENVVFSPASINLAFGLLYEGSGGDTRAQIGRILPPPADPLGYASDEKDVEVSVANALFLDRDFRFRDSYVSRTRRAYDAAAIAVDYSDAVASAKTINDWADKATRGLIPNVISPPAIDESMIAVLANALYFEGLWKTKLLYRKQHPFLFGNGAEEPFTFVGQTFDVAYASRGDWEAIRLPYRNERYAMDIVMPRNREVMERAASAQLLESFAGDLSKAKPDLVEVEIPQFETDYSQSLVAPLKAIGLTLPFAKGEADFSAMVEPGQPPVVVSDVRHLTKLQVYDEGTKAAAVTTISIITTSARILPKEPRRFRADRPFMIVLRDLEQGAILFVGRIADPQPFEPEVEEP